MITIDASVFVSAALSGEAGSPECLNFLSLVARQEIPVICPSLLLP